MARRKKSLVAQFAPLSLSSAHLRHPEEVRNAALEAIWQVVCAIPRGQVSTYGAVARAAGLPGRARQAGYALRVAPELLKLPWHRVVGAGGRIAFPESSAAYAEQRRRLRAEGVSVRNGLVDRSALTDLAEL